MIRVMKIKKNSFLLIMALIAIVMITLNLHTYANINDKYKILIDVEDSKLFLFENGKVIKTYKCSGGKTTTPSPIGTWKITFKAKWGEGFGGSFLGLNVPWGNFGIHGTLDSNSLGWASSHRMY